MGRIREFTNAEALFQSAAELILALALKLESGNPFTIALSGGSTPRGLYQRMASDGMKSQFPWPKMHFFLTDERWVPATDPQSNFRMAQETLLKPVEVAQGHIHPIHTSLGSPEASAREYEEKITHFFNTGPGEFPVFNLILLGLGTDGHTASLFSGDPATLEEKRLVMPALLNSELPRVTLTFPVINRAQNVVFLVCGAEKQAIFHKIFHQNPGPKPLPAQKVRPAAGELYWFVSRG
ncbi:MAG: 6-phosphogluconolactonase [Candidatus Omnitrophica bacterium]|nr:6-phosphogluconolactonase [Candidatus Omnitrophota bacterium]